MAMLAEILEVLTAASTLHFAAMLYVGLCLAAFLVVQVLTRK